jgi:hypothetical protein
MTPDDSQYIILHMRPTTIGGITIGAIIRALINLLPGRSRLS